jgi:hypothetical protein
MDQIRRVEMGVLDLAAVKMNEADPLTGVAVEVHRVGSAFEAGDAITVALAELDVRLVVRHEAYRMLRIAKMSRLFNMLTIVKMG